MIKFKLLTIFVLITFFVYGQTGAQTNNPKEAQSQPAPTTKTWQCGKSLIATLEGSTLTISGEGKMGNFGTWGENTPWEQYRNNIKEVKLNGVTNIAAWAFANCKNLTTITIPKGVTSIGSQAFSKCNSLTSIIVPSSVVTIGASVFSNCTNLTSIKLLYNLTTIGEFAFGNCKALISIVIPGSVTEFGNTPFPSCNALTSMTVYSSQPPLLKGGTVFDKNAPNYANCILYVPRSAIEAYKKAEGWKDFVHIQEIP
jgi:hypothetical protein